MQDLFFHTDGQLKRNEKLEALLPAFKERADEYDRNARFPFDNFGDLKEAGFFSLTVPEQYGGQGAGLYDYLLVQEKIAEGDAATALSLGWHNGLVMQLRDTGKWESDTFEAMCREIAEKGVLMNSAATEPATGSPARGGKPETTAVRLPGGGFEITGKKTFTSLAPILDYFIVTATVEETGETGEFKIPRDSEGLSIEETWDTLGMRATRSDDLILDRVKIGEADWVAKRQPGHGRGPQGWLLHIPACYLGTAKAARNDAVAFAETYQPNSLDHPISQVPEVRRKTAEMDLKLMQARHFMYHVAKLWDDYPDRRSELGGELAAVKTTATNLAVEVVDLAMRIVGGQSLMKSRPFERYYRDVRAGLHNPPSDDITVNVLASKAFPKNK
ncbi:acyl-CoA dehydrogenase family protein [Alteribacter natronophilus]|uniref:acyl-CoA dehydrogenase family protein n=1 Tax=Alteribacter natronophilus TaxID=2583810 RepID=UPI00110DB815|nr:acyl-CoA dehydrogenase family protein [Alteribacter natronophilus]TMW70661.1 acyl-CoA dehydrogenase [Alteribacter natronophilus]